MSQAHPLSAITGVIAVYEYTLSYGVIPLVIVNKKINRKELKKYDGWMLGGIILTKKDLSQGQDVFALKFTHMQKHATFIAGKDVLRDVVIEEKYVRLALENMLRVMLIDLREMMVKGNFPGGQQLAKTLEHIREHTQQRMHDDEKKLITCITLCEKEIMKYKDLLAIYEVLEDITKKVNVIS